MECGHQDLNGSPPGSPAAAGTGWLPDGYARDNTEIIHRNIKPKNVFLGLQPTNGHFADYPTIMLGDFGLAFKTWTPNANVPGSTGDALNPHAFLGAGTAGFRAPEMRAYVNRQTGAPVDRIPMSSKTNVWGVGMIIHCLLCLEPEPAQPDWVGDPMLFVLNTAFDAVDNYDPALYTLVQDCLNPDPVARPDFRTIIRRVEVCIDENGLNLAEDMRQLPSAQAPAVHRLRTAADVYAIGLAFATLDPP
ncbi:hypothetical protein LTR08_005741 [Meristemomyces frigidus]|nr:hypothetical protein LTR08_005741 [Meristemomyces frigidus]